MTTRPPADNHAPDPDEGVYVISVAAELLGVHPQTLRGYERQGLLNPTRTSGGTRLYSRADVTRAKRVVELSNEGLTLTGIARVLALEDRIARLTKPSTALVPTNRRSGPSSQTLNARGRPGATPRSRRGPR